MNDDVWVIEARQDGLLDRVREVWAYRRLLWHFTVRAFRDMYSKTALGWLWMTMRVAGPIGVMALFFGGVLNVKSEGVPYFLFFLCGMTTWMLFERSLIVVTRSVERNRKLITKVYFPRLILPIASVATTLVYLALLLVVLIGTLIHFHRQDGIWYIPLRPQLLVAVLMILASFVFTTGVGLWTSVLQARYRDVRYGLRYLMPFWFYFTPVIYPVTRIPEEWRWVAHLNPMTGVVETFKWATLGAGQFSPASFAGSVVLITATVVSGLWYFTREESASVDKL